MKKPTERFISVRITAEEYQILKNLCDLKRKSMSSVATALIKKYIEKIEESQNFYK